MSSETIHLERYSDPAKHAVARAQSLADDMTHSQVTPDHVLAVLLEREHGVKALERASFDAKVILQRARDRLNALEKRPGTLSYLSAQTLKLLERAEERAEQQKRKNVDVECLFYAFVKLDYLSLGLFATPWPEAEWGSASELPKATPPNRTRALATSAKPLKDFVDSIFTSVATPWEKLAPHAAATLAQIRRTLGYPVPPPRLLIETLHDLKLKLSCENVETAIVLVYAERGLVLEFGDQSVTFQWHEDVMAWKSDTGAELFATLEAFLVRFYPELTQA